jgi:hypothetical protein
MNFNRWLLIIILAFALVACAFVTQPITFQGTNVLTKDVYIQSHKTNGVVLLDINWGRWWSCGGHENAQLLTLAFDKLPARTLENEAEPSLVVQSPSRVMVDPVFLNYAFSLEPGEYALSTFSIKVADSVTKVGFLTAQRSELYEDGKPAGGSFTVKQGETVFIGNFYLGCKWGPTLWRYYPKDRDAFNKQIAMYKNSFPFLDLGDVKYRLFKTSVFGYDYELAP